MDNLEGGSRTFVRFASAIAVAAAGDVGMVRHGCRKGCAGEGASVPGHTTPC
ncbi:hypothetical protein OHA_1_02186 [Pleomorphomonas sp. SM30]|uniref:Uncharacterized protein n=1 Tax=Oharaeibacter diazotrophicus TaxID=1920512 RepID=A0A4R6R9I9_9HYPH|nr:hypothetical protein EDD54_3918 [Oharaeibacter diazotrophicus]BBE72588.1 hypothetical protein OHA_1_02186 [Pleomorphomonas sp. SM30]